jgi:DNA-binding CsgD family transcriptional regulator
MSAADVLHNRADIILDRYQEALNEANSPLMTPRERWEACFRQAKAILDESVAVLRGDTARRGEAYTLTREIGAQRELHQVSMADSLRAGMLLWRSAVSVLRESLSVEEASCEPQLSAAMESLHDAICLRLHIEMLADDHVNLIHQITSPVESAPQPDISVAADLDAAASDSLTTRERQVLEAVARAQSNRAIAQELGVTETTVKSHLQKIFRKLDATSRVDAITRAGIYPLPTISRASGWSRKVSSLDFNRTRQVGMLGDVTLSSTAFSDGIWYEASPAQRGIWVLDRIERLRPAYLFPSVLEFAGSIDHALMVSAIERVLSRHAALRSRFRLNVRCRRVEFCTDGEPPAVRFWAAGDHWPREELNRHIEEFCYSPFDLAAEPPARADVIRVDATTTILVLTAHHIVFDGWSRRLVLAEIATTYQAALLGREPELAEPAHPAQVLTAASKEDVAAQVEAVVERLRGAPTGVALPYDRTPVDDSPLVSAVTAIRFDSELTRALMTEATQAGCSAFILAVAILAATLARTGKQTDFLFAVVWPGRDDPAAHAVVGMFMNTVVLRVSLDEHTTWRELLLNARVGAHEAFINADAPLSVIVSELDKGGGVSGQPLTPVMINLADVSTPFELAPGVQGRYRPLGVMYSKWDLTIFVHLEKSFHGNQLDLSLDYPVQLFELTTITGLLTELRRSATDLINHPEESVLEKSIELDLNDPSVRLELVRSAWREILSIDEVDDDTGFFDAGGDSLLLVALVEHLSKASGRVLKTMDVFRAASIGGQAALLARPSQQSHDGM